MAHGVQLAVCGRTKPQALYGVAAVAGDMKHLLTRQRGFDRAAQLARGQCRKNHVAINRQLATEAAANVAADDMHIAERYAQRGGHTFLRAVDQLR